MSDLLTFFQLTSLTNFLKVKIVKETLQTLTDDPKKKKKKKCLKKGFSKKSSSQKCTFIDVVCRELVRN